MLMWKLNNSYKRAIGRTVQLINIEHNPMLAIVSINLIRRVAYSSSLNWIQQLDKTYENSKFSQPSQMRRN